MRVLVFESDEGASTPVVDELTAAGIEVARCHDPEGPAFPCKGLQDHRACPLDGAPVSAAVLTGPGTHTEDGLSSREQGARCALRQHIPLVVVGPRTASPMSAFTTTFAAGPETAVDAIRAAAAARLPRHEAAAIDAFRLVLDTHDLAGVDADVAVTHRDGGLRVELRPSAGIPEKVAEIAGVRAMGAVRAVDSDAAFISVAIEPGRTISSVTS
jgi:hypothetical protein